MIKTSNNYLMMIEPLEDSKEPINDEYVSIAELIWSLCSASEGSYRGFHRCKCGKTSDNKDWFTPKGRTTNSLLVHYVKNHRDEVPNSELDKLLDELN